VYILTLLLSLCDTFTVGMVMVKGVNVIPCWQHSCLGMVLNLILLLAENFGGEAGVFGEEPSPPPVDRTLGVSHGLGLGLGLSHTVELWFWCLQGLSLSLGGC